MVDILCRGIRHCPTAGRWSAGQGKIGAFLDRHGAHHIDGRFQSGSLALLKEGWAVARLQSKFECFVRTF